MNRRSFVRNTSYGAFASALGPFCIPAGWTEQDVTHLTILHTNDVHSRIDPFPMDGGRNQGKGGVIRRKQLIDQIRSEGQPCLLMDAGDIFQGTPYFNLFKGELEMKLMSQLNYDFATMGNHDFDVGVSGFSEQLVHANFPFITSNYDFSNTELEGRTFEYQVKDIGDVKIGIYGLGIELRGLVPQKLYGETIYLDPVSTAHKMERLLKKEMNCDYVICLSHVGYRYRDRQVSDVVLAEATRWTDLIIGGHTHTFMAQPHLIENQRGRAVMINQVGWAGMLLGRIDLFFEKGSRRKTLKSQNILVKT